MTTVSTIFLSVETETGVEAEIETGRRAGWVDEAHTCKAEVVRGTLRT